MGVPDNHPEQPVAAGSLQSADRNLRKTMGLSHLLLMSIAAIISAVILSRL
jgi:hypothetical protein